MEATGNDTESPTEKESKTETKAKMSLVDSGHSEEDFSIISEGTSEFSLMDASSEISDKDTGKSKNEQEHSPPGAGISSSSDGTNVEQNDQGLKELKDGKYSNTSETSDFSNVEQNHPGLKDVKDRKSSNTSETSNFSNVEQNDLGLKDLKDRKSSNTSEMSDFSILNMPDDDKLNCGDFEVDSGSKFRSDEFKIDPAELRKDLGASTGQVISINRPHESTSQDSELGSSFAIINDTDKSSSYPSEFDLSLPRSKVFVLPPKEERDENNEQHIKSFGGGITEIPVQREEWKRTDFGKSDLETDGGSKDVSNTESECKSRETSDSFDDDSTNRKDANTEEENRSDNTAEVAKTNVDGEANNTGDETEVDDEPQTTNPEKKFELDEESNDSENNGDENFERLLNNDPKPVNACNENRPPPDQAQGGIGKQNLGERETTTSEEEASNDAVSVACKDRKQSEDFSLVDISEVSGSHAPGPLGKSDTDSDVTSSQSESRSRSSTSSVEIHMEQPELETSDENMDESTEKLIKRKEDKGQNDKKADVSVTKIKEVESESVDMETDKNTEPFTEVSRRDALSINDEAAGTTNSDGDHPVNTVDVNGGNDRRHSASAMNDRDHGDTETSFEHVSKDNFEEKANKKEEKKETMVVIDDEEEKEMLKGVPHDKEEIPENLDMLSKNVEDSTMPNMNNDSNQDFSFVEVDSKAIETEDLQFENKKQITEDHTSKLNGEEEKEENHDFHFSGGDSKTDVNIISMNSDTSRNDNTQEGQEILEEVGDQDEKIERKSSNVSDSSSSTSPDSWQPVDGFRVTTEDEEKLERSMKKQHGILVNVRYSLTSQKAHESKEEEFEIDMESVLDYRKWVYILNRKETFLKVRFTDAYFNFDQSYGKLDIFVSRKVKDQQELQKWYSEVIEVVKGQVDSLFGCVICCLQGHTEAVMSKVKDICSKHELDADVESVELIEFLSKELSKNSIVVIGYPNIAEVLLEIDANLVQLYQSQDGNFVSLALQNIPISEIQHNVLHLFDAEKELISEFPCMIVKLKSDALKFIVKKTLFERVLCKIKNNWLKFHHVSKLSLQPMKFTLMCKTSVRDYIVKSKLQSTENDFRWKFLPDKGEIILYTEDQQQSDEIRNSIFSSLKMYEVNAADIPLESLTKTDEWAGLVEDIQKQSNGMVEIFVDNNQSLIKFVGTDDVMTTWQKFGTLGDFEKQIFKIAENLASPFPLPVKMLVKIESTMLSALQDRKGLIESLCHNMNVDIRSTDEGFEVQGTDKSKVKDVCDRLLNFEEVLTPEKIHKTFVQMEEKVVDLVYKQKIGDLKNYSEELHVDFDITNLGFEVKGKNEENVNKFRDYLLRIKDELSKVKLPDEDSDEFDPSNNVTEQVIKSQKSVVKTFVQMEENLIDLVYQHKITDLKSLGEELNVEFDITNLGFEVKGKKEEAVNRFRDYLLYLKQEVGKNQAPQDSHEQKDVLVDKPCACKTTVELDDGAITFIKKFKMVELDELRTNLEVALNMVDKGFEVTGEKEIDVKTMCDYIWGLKCQIETIKLKDVTDFQKRHIQKLDQKYQCIVKLLDDSDEIDNHSKDLDPDELAVWAINGMKLAVAVKKDEGLSCEAIIKPMNQEHEESSKCKFIYQEKSSCDEVEMPAPFYTQESESLKEEMAKIFMKLFAELNDIYTLVAFPTVDFNGWPPGELTSIFLTSLTGFLRTSKHLNFEKIILYSQEREVSLKLIDIIEAALPSFRKSGLDIKVVKKHDKKLEGNIHQEIADQNQEEAVENEVESPPPVPPRAKDVGKPQVKIQLKPEIRVVKGAIAQQEVEAIVNTTSPDFDLKRGAVSKSLLEAAGSDLQKEVKKSAKVKAENTVVVVTRGFKLKCKSVFHGALQGYDKHAHIYEQPSVKILRKFVKNCLLQAHMRNYRSIAFPVLGAGELEFPPDVVATAMIDEVEIFRNDFSHTTNLQEVRVVVYRDEGIHLIFKKMVDAYQEDYLKNTANPTSSVTHKNSQDTLKHPEPLKVQQPATKDPSPKPKSPVMPTQGINIYVGHVNLSACLGDVTKLDGFEGLILLWPKEEIDSTPVDKERILNSVGPSSFKHWETGKESLYGDKVLVTPGGDLPQKTIIHVYVYKCSGNYKLKEAFSLGLAKAEELKMKNVVIPVRPTDQLAIDPGNFSACVFNAVTDMCDQLNTVGHVRVCIGGKHLCQPIMATLAKLKETAELRKKLPTCSVEITALKDDMTSIVSEVEHQILAERNTEEATAIEDTEVKDRTLTKDDGTFLHDISSRQFLVNIKAEIAPEIVQVVRQSNQLAVMKQFIERNSEQVMVEEDQGKWLLYGLTYSHFEIGMKSMQEFWEKYVADQAPEQTGLQPESSSETLKIKVDITRDMFQALMYLERRKFTDIVGSADVRFSDKSGTVEVIGNDLDQRMAKSLKDMIGQFQHDITMDGVEIPYRNVGETTQDQFVASLQNKYPEVYIYSNESNGAESCFNVYIVSLSRDDVSKVKRSIQTEFLKTSNRTGRFAQSVLENHGKNGGHGNFNRSFSHQDRHPKPKCFKTAEGLEIHVYMGNILRLNVDCIVNAANEHLSHGGGIAEVISNAAGKGFDQECEQYVKSYGKVQTGKCCVTNAGRLPYKRVIHAVGPVWSDRKTNECCDLLQRAIENCIKMANAHGMKSVAIPSISAGLFGMPLELCAKCYAVGVMTMSASITKGKWTLKEVHFIDNKPEIVSKVQAAFKEFFEDTGVKQQQNIERFPSFTKGTLLKGHSTADNLKTNEGFNKTENYSKEISVPFDSESKEATVKSKDKTSESSDNDAKILQPGHFTINQNEFNHDGFPTNARLPSQWHVTIRPNLMEIKTDKDFTVLIHEQDFNRFIMESIAFGVDPSYAKSSVYKSMATRPDIKTKIKLLQDQLPEPSVGTLVSFELVYGNYVQNVFVLITPQYDKDAGQEACRKFRDDLYMCYLKLFQEAADTKMEYLAVTFLKTGRAGVTFKEGANIFLQAINTFSSKKDTSCGLKQIHLILNPSKNAFEEIKEVLERNFHGRGHLVQMNEKVNTKELGMIGCRKIKEDQQGTQNGEMEPEQMEKKIPQKVDEKLKSAKNCAICLEVIQDGQRKVLDKCKHEFCQECIDACFEHKPVCPTCGAVYGVVTGNQPYGTMKVEHRPKVHLPGFPKCGHYWIMYHIPDGKQTEDHQNPGKSFRGTKRLAYIPANEKGTLVMKLLKIAFERKLVFTIGHSRTTGEENVVTWNDIHHKTSMSGGPEGFGYPDPDYLDRVLDELAAKGVTSADIKTKK